MCPRGEARVRGVQPTHPSLPFLYLPSFLPPLILFPPCCCSLLKCGRRSLQPFFVSFLPHAPLISLCRCSLVRLYQSMFSVSKGGDPTNEAKHPVCSSGSLCHAGSMLLCIRLSYLSTVLIIRCVLSYPSLRPGDNIFVLGTGKLVPQATLTPAELHLSELMVSFTA